MKKNSTEKEWISLSYAASLALGYVIGALNPAAFIGWIKHVDLRGGGTKNLGASNTMLLVGKKYGALVMVLDIFKAYLASKLASWLFPKVAAAHLMAGLGAVLGHVFPFYMGFRGGKGLAAFGGMALAYNPWMFFGLLTLGVVLMLIFNVSYVMPMSVAVLFPVLVLLHSKNAAMFLISAVAGVIIVVKHWSNIEKGKQGRDIDLRKLAKDILKIK